MTTEEINMPKNPAPAKAPETRTEGELAIAALQAEAAVRAAAETRNQAHAKLATLETWRQYQQAVHVVRTLQPEIGSLPGYSEFEAAEKALQAAAEAHQAAFEAWQAATK